VGFKQTNAYGGGGVTHSSIGRLDGLAAW